MKNILEKRFFALIADFLIVSFTTFVLSGFIKITFVLCTFSLMGKEFYFSFSLYPFILLTYFIIFDILSSGQTIGKGLFHIKVVFLHNDNTVINRILRSLIKTFGISTLIFCPIYYLVTKNTPQDRVMNTMTIDIKTEKITVN